MNKPILQPEDLDHLGEALIALTQEVWVLRDRQKVLEKLLLNAGVLDAKALDSFQPDAEMKAMLDMERQQLVDTVLGALSGKKF
jgi:hypothetical protein